MRRRVVPELDDAGVVLQCGLDNAALYAPATAVDEAYLAKAGGGRRIHVFGHDRRDIARREGVEIELALDGDTDGVGHVRHT